MAGCKFEIFVSAYLDGELSDEERRLFEGHLRRCDTCYALVTQWKEVERSLRRQSLRDGLAANGRVAESVRRDLSRSGAFRRARRRSRLRRARAHAARYWPRYALGLVLLALGLWAGWATAPAMRRGRESEGPSGLEERGAEFAPPTVDEILAEADASLRTLVRGAGKRPGTARRVAEDARAQGLPERLSQVRASVAADDELRESLLRIETAVTLVANLPPDQADRKGRQIAEAIRRAELLDQIERTRGRLRVEVY